MSWLLSEIDLESSSASQVLNLIHLHANAVNHEHFRFGLGCDHIFQFSLTHLHCNKATSGAVHMGSCLGYDQVRILVMTACAINHTLTSCNVSKQTLLQHFRLLFVYIRQNHVGANTYVKSTAYQLDELYTYKT